MKHIVDPSKREFLRKAGLGAGLVVVGPGILAACGDDDDDAATDEGTSTTSSTAATTTTTTTTTTTAAAAELTQVGFQLGWLPSVQYAGSFIAEERGYYAAEALEVEIFPGGPNNPVDPTIVSGQALIGVGATDYAARANQEGAGYKIIGSKNQSHAFCVTSLADNPVENPRALESGARIGVATINQPVIDAIVALNDLDASKLTIVPTQGDPAPLANGEVDCFLTLFTTGPIDLELQGLETHSWLLSEYGYHIFAGVNMVLESTLADPDQRELAKRLFKADLRGWHDFVEDTAYATDLTVDKYAADQDLNRDQQLLQAEAQLTLLVTPETEANGLFTMSAEKIQQNIDTMSLIGPAIDESLFVTDLLDEIYAEGF